jgi:hypothetical protein
MIAELPLYVSIIFILTALLTIWFFSRAFERTSSKVTQTLFFLIPFWLFFQGFLASGSFYVSSPPFLFLFGILPTLIFVVILFAFFRESIISKLSLKNLTRLHLIRVPIEIILWQLFVAGQIPQIMTFEGRNFDILSGLSVPLVLWFGFQKNQPRRTFLIIWNVLALILLINIVAQAALSLETPFQQISFEQPNRAVLYFPFVWLPTTIVPLVLFSHLTSLYLLLRK